MAGFDSSTIVDKTSNASTAADASTKLSQEANAETGRGHCMHAGNEDKDAHIPPPQPKIGEHAVVSTTPGIDVSEFQGTIDWSQVQQSGVNFAYVRATEGTTIQDADFVKNWQGAQQAGVPVGPYHYFTTASPVQSQIDNFVAELKLVKPGDLPPVLDVENPAQFAKFTTAQNVQMIQQWLDGVEQKTGVQPMLYMSSAFSSQVLADAPQFDKYKLWVADYTTAAQPTVPKPWTNWNFWQHAEDGKVSGITGNVDLDYFNGSAQTLPVVKQ